MLRGQVVRAEEQPVRILQAEGLPVLGVAAEAIGPAPRRNIAIDIRIRVEEPPHGAAGGQDFIQVFRAGVVELVQVNVIGAQVFQAGGKLGNDAAKAQTKLADLALSRATTQAALVKQQIAQELLVARRAVQAAKSQLELRELAAKVAERKLSDHRALYAAGKIAAALLASVQAEAASEALGAAEARAALSKAVVSLHSAAGSLLSGMKLSI